MTEVKDTETAPSMAELNAEGTPAREDLVKRIEHTLNKIRPYIQSDGGDVQFIDFQDGIVTVSMLGACAGCMAIDSTLNDGIEAILVDEIPEVIKVVMLENNPFNMFY